MSDIVNLYILSYMIFYERYIDINIKKKKGRKRKFKFLVFL